MRLEGDLKIALCDYSGHPFQVQLSRELARRGHKLLHLYFAEFQTPKGALEPNSADPPTLRIEAVSLGRPFAKYSFLRRRFQEQRVGTVIADRIQTFEPDVVVGCNLPLDALNQIISRSRMYRWPFVFWQQDIYSFAIASILKRKLGWVGSLIGAYYRRLEKIALAESSAVVVISDEFKLVLEKEFCGVARSVHTVENWAPLDEIRPTAKVNAWSLENGFETKQTVLYTGTLGMKHDPSQILDLALALKDRADVAVVVISDGPAAEWVRSEAAKHTLPGLQVLPFQPYSRYSEVLGSADVLISVLEPDAGVFSVPSKVLSYLCAGRPIVLSAPQNNLASQIIRNADAGQVVTPGDSKAFSAAVLRLLDDRHLRQRLGSHARAYAEQTFDINAIGSRFEAILYSLREKPILHR